MPFSVRSLYVRTPVLSLIIPFDAHSSWLLISTVPPVILIVALSDNLVTTSFAILLSSLIVSVPPRMFKLPLVVVSTPLTSLFFNELKLITPFAAVRSTSPSQISLLLKFNVPVETSVTDSSARVSTRVESTEPVIKVSSLMLTLPVPLISPVILSVPFRLIVPVLFTFLYVVTPCEVTSPLFEFVKVPVNVVVPSVFIIE